MKHYTKAVSDAYWKLRSRMGDQTAQEVYQLIKAMIIEQGLPDEEQPPAIWVAMNEPLATASELLERHWSKLSAELPDVYEFLAACTASVGKPFQCPGITLTTSAQGIPPACEPGAEDPASGTPHPGTASR